MNSDRLHNLLQQADAVLGNRVFGNAVPAADGTSPEVLAASVRRLSRQRRQRKLLVCTGLAVVVIGAALWQRPQLSQLARDNASLPDAPPTEKQSPNALSTTEQLQAALATLDSEQRLVDRLLMAERQQRARALTDDLQAPLGLPAADMEQLDRAASALVLAAERKEQRPQLLAAAREDYNLVVQLFPNTPWADLAQDRLLNIAPQHTP